MVKRLIVLDHLKNLAHKAIFLLQETHTQESDKDSYRHMWGTKDFELNHGSTNSRGTAIFFQTLGKINFFFLIITAGCKSFQ